MCSLYVHLSICNNAKKIYFYFVAFITSTTAAAADEKQQQQSFQALNDRLISSRDDIRNSGEVMIVVEWTNEGCSH